MPNGKYCTYVKDFSEGVADEQLKNFRRYIELVKSGEYVFLVANTGPLIATFGNVFSRDLQTQLVNAIDRNDAAINDYDSVHIVVLNAATIDNSSFVAPFLTKILNSDLWSPCADCDKRDSCPIYTNAQIVQKSSDRVVEFITNHYIWQQEHDRKLTIRQIVAHLTYSLTGGMNCNDVRRMPTNLGISQYKFINLFSNLFFGYKGFARDQYGCRITAIGEILDAKYDQHRLKDDEKLFILGDFQSFLPEVRTILNDIRGWDNKQASAWQAAVRRAYTLFDTNPDPSSREQLNRDIFSFQFPRYLEIRHGGQVSSLDKSLVVSALQMLFTGSRSKESGVKITFMRSSGITQSVQVVLDEIRQRDFVLTSEDVNDFDDSTTHKRLVLSVKGTGIHTEITLPMLDYFDEISRGAIATSVDPLLSHGIDSIKAQLISNCTSEEDSLSLATMSAGGWSEIEAIFDPLSEIWTITQ